MYFPYLHARGVEKSAIISTIVTYTHNKIVPIIDPYDVEEEEIFTNRNLYKICRELVNNSKMFIVIVNEITDLNAISLEIGTTFNNYCIYGFLASDNPNMANSSGIQTAIIHDTVSSNNLDSTDVLYHIFLPATVALLTYVRQYPQTKRIIIEDGFELREPNNTYPATSVFSDLFSTYQSLDYIGFGDYLTLGERFRPGGRANLEHVTAALHLTYSNGTMLHIKHFISTPIQLPHINGRISDVMAQAVGNIGAFLPTCGISLLQQKYANGTGTTNLATLKRISLEHHIEVIDSLI